VDVSVDERHENLRNARFHGPPTAIVDVSVDEDHKNLHNRSAHGADPTRFGTRRAAAGPEEA
jgi:hypothetical protein